MGPDRSAGASAGEAAEHVGPSPPATFSRVGDAGMTPWSTDATVSSSESKTLTGTGSAPAAPVLGPLRRAQQDPPSHSSPASCACGLKVAWTPKGEEDESARALPELLPQPKGSHPQTALTQEEEFAALAYTSLPGGLPPLRRCKTAPRQRGQTTHRPHDSVASTPCCATAWRTACGWQCRSRLHLRAPHP